MLKMMEKQLRFARVGAVRSHGHFVRSHGSTELAPKVKAVCALVPQIRVLAQIREIDAGTMSDFVRSHRRGARSHGISVGSH